MHNAVLPNKSGNLESASAERVDPYRGALHRGIVINILGMAVKGIGALWVPVATWLYGASVMGGFWLAVPVEEFCASLVAAGLSDAATIYASHHVEDAQTSEDAERRLYGVLGTIFNITLSVSLVLGTAIALLSGWVTRTVFPSHPEVEPAIGWLAFSIAPNAFASVAIAAAKAKLAMQYDPIINGIVRPLTLTIATFSCWAMSRSIESLMIAIWLSNVATALACLYFLAKLFDTKKLLVATLRPSWDKRLIGFAIPQSLNLTLNRYIARLDILILGWYGTSSAELALYGSASWLTSQLRTIRTTFSSALAPIAARHHAAGNHDLLARGLADMSRWSSSLVIPPVLLAVVLRNDILHLVSREFPPDTRFAVLLLIPAFVGTAFGIAGNALVFTGHSRYNLLNSFIVAILNTAFALFLVPRYGTIGAAIAIAIATTIQTAAQAVELSFLEKVEISPRLVYKPFLAMLPPILLLLPFWDPASLPSLWMRVALALGLLLLYIGMLVILRLEDLAPLGRKWSAYRRTRLADASNQR
jgi:O-antigen/teichoic acid export membrane protein